MPLTTTTTSSIYNNRLAIAAIAAAACLTTLTTTTDAFYMNRVTPKDFSKAPSDFREEPVVLEEALSTSECDAWLQHIFKRSSQELVLVQKGCGKEMLHAKLPLEEAVQEAVKKSSHWDPVRLSSIGSKACSTDQLPLQELVKSLYNKAEETDTDKEEDKEEEDKEDTDDDEDSGDALDWFDCFASHIPVHDTLFMAGNGAPSPTIQCHPFTKFHLCIDGSQMIRLLPPLPFRSNAVLEEHATPIVQEAWDGFPMSLGCQTKLDASLNLFAHRHRDVDHACEDPKLRDLKAGTNLYEQFQHWSEDAGMFTPNFHVPVETASSQQQPKLHHDAFHSSVLITGDMVVIPPGWWYQTYHLEPSVSLQTQRCQGTETATQFIDHIIQASGMDFMFEDENESHTKEEAQGVVDTLFELLEEHYDKEEDEQNVNRRNKKYHEIDYNDQDEDPFRFESDQFE